MWVRGLRKWGKVRLDIVRKAKGQRGFAVVPWRWIVERTFAWLGRYYDTQYIGYYICKKEANRFSLSSTE
jgi:hypothetical protein